jgi:hypothetical protein
VSLKVSLPYPQSVHKRSDFKEGIASWKGNISCLRHLWLHRTQTALCFVRYWLAGANMIKACISKHRVLMGLDRVWHKRHIIMSGFSCETLKPWLAGCLSNTKRRCAADVWWMCATLSCHSLDRSWKSWELQTLSHSPHKHECLMQAMTTNSHASTQSEAAAVRYATHTTSHSAHPLQYPFGCMDIPRVAICSTANHFMQSLVPNLHSEALSMAWGVQMSMNLWLNISNTK